MWSKKVTDLSEYQQEKSSGSLGVAVIKECLKTLPTCPGVYRMINHDHDVLYVGKAKNLKKRVSSYTNLQRQTIRIRRMVGQTQYMDFITTHTEGAALLLDANLINKNSPR